MTALSPQPLSPLDGRYRRQTGTLDQHLSEAGLNRARIHVEVEWLIHLTDRELLGARRLTDAEKSLLRALPENFGDGDVAALAEREAVTRHDVKAVEYLVRDRLEQQGLGALAEAVHIACTSEYINNLSYALTIRAAVQEVWLPAFRAVIDRLRELAEEPSDRWRIAMAHHTWFSDGQHGDAGVYLDADLKLWRGEAYATVLEERVMLTSRAITDVPRSGIVDEDREDGGSDDNDDDPWSKDASPDGKTPLPPVQAGGFPALRDRRLPYGDDGSGEPR